MLNYLQSQAGEIDLLPALPKAWPAGSAKGLRARGGFEVAMQWQAGRLTNAQIKSLLGQPLRVRLGERTAEFALRRGQTLQLNGQLEGNIQ